MSGYDLIRGGLNVLISDDDDAINEVCRVRQVLLQLPINHRTKQVDALATRLADCIVIRAEQISHSSIICQ